jgi:hypothetical protein
MERRAFVAGTLALLAEPRAAGAQQGKAYRVGYVSSGTREQNTPFLRALEEGLSRLGYLEGQNLRLE